MSDSEYTAGMPAAGSMVDRVANFAVTFVPLILIAVAVWQSWGGLLVWEDLLIFFATLIPFGFGITVGFHRLFTHRAFKTTKTMRFVWAVLGSMALEGPVIEWVAYHRRHHQFSDEAGDPHSPHHDHGHGFRGAIRGLFHAHVGWVLFSDEPAEEERYAPDLMADPVVRFVDRTFVLWAVLGLAIPFGLGYLLTGTLVGGLLGLLWGGAVRIFVLHHITFCVNSLCHFFGRRDYETGDESRNVAWLAPFTFGEAWHNNHHAFPTSARHGLGRAELDPSAALITLMEKTGLAWDVVKISPERMASKAAA
ncbi:MAG TPA: acyl-CoA desaturase [Solirubrobacterales bacterium]|nr:acyl-CoA desaturase [Solirubrobacterales bacterium]